VFGTIKRKASSTAAGASKMLVTRQRLAFALAPALPALYFLVVLYPTSSGDTGRNYVVLMLLIALSVSYLSCFLLGAPLISFLKRKRHLNTIYLSIGGAVLGAVVFYIFGFGFSALLDSSRSMVPSFSELVYGAALGVLVALPFGLIAGYPFIGSEDLGSNRN
jgi:uncharacterized BrkB/YihY/UPF0761 family membrane protein